MDQCADTFINDTLTLIINNYITLPILPCNAQKKPILNLKSKEHSYYKNCNAKRRESGKGNRIKRKAEELGEKFVNKIWNTIIRRVPEAALLMMQYGLPYRGMVENLNYDRAMRKKLGFSHNPSPVYDGRK